MDQFDMAQMAHSKNEHKSGNDGNYEYDQCKVRNYDKPLLSERVSGKSQE